MNNLNIYVCENEISLPVFVVVCIFVKTILFRTIFFPVGVIPMKKMPFWGSLSNQSGINNGCSVFFFTKIIISSFK